MTLVTAQGSGQSWREDREVNDVAGASQPFRQIGICPIKICFKKRKKERKKERSEQHIKKEKAVKEKEYQMIMKPRSTRQTGVTG